MFTAQVSISPDPLIYFFSHSAVFVLICATVFFILGLLFGKFTWGRYKRQTRLLLQEADTQKSEIVTLKRKLAEMAARSGVPMPAPDNNATRGEISGSDPVMRSFLDTAASVLPQEGAPVVSEKTVTGSIPAPISLSKLIASVETKPGEEQSKESAPSPATQENEKQEAASVPVPTLETTEVEAHDAGDLIKAKMDAMRALIERGQQLSQAQNAAATPASVTADQPDIHHQQADTRSPAPGIHPTTGSDIRQNVTTAESRLHSDPYLGLIYTKQPAQSDDLTQLKGVASVIEGKLNEFGVYTFKQIALWDDEHIREFSNRLSFKDRISRERWVDQARELHKQKHGESL